MLAAGGRQLENVLEDSVLRRGAFTSTGRTRRKTHVDGPRAIAVGAVSLSVRWSAHQVRAPGRDEQRLDAQGDKLMARLVYRRMTATSRSSRSIPSTRRQAGAACGGTSCASTEPRRRACSSRARYAPDSAFRWMASPAMDAAGNIGIGYSYGSPTEFAGQRFAGRFAADPPGRLNVAGDRDRVGRSGADEYGALGGLLADGGGSERRLYDLVCWRLSDARRDNLLDSYRGPSVSRLRTPPVTREVLHKV